MGLEDREWRREDLRQQGHKASWDYFKAKGPKPEPVEPLKIEQEAYDSARLRKLRGLSEKVPKPVKQRTPPSYVHLQAQEILDARRQKKSAFLPLAICALVFAIVVGVVLYP